MPVKNRLAEMHDEITAWRRDIHEHPEILFETHRTSALVADKLKAFGCDEVTTGIGRTGVVAVIRGRTDRSNKVIGLRCDMDALPILEATGLAYASTNEGVMPACGHDGHTAMLLGAARCLAEEGGFDGTVHFIFQPAEEGFGGAAAMMRDGLFDQFPVDSVWGMHNFPTVPVGQFITRTGAFMACSDSVSVRINGVGGHGAMP